MNNTKNKLNNTAMKKRKKNSFGLKQIGLFIWMLILAAGANAQILSFEFNTGGSLNSSFNNTNITTSTISAVGTLTNSSAVSSANGWQFNGWTTALDVTRYFQFTVTPQANRSFSVTQMVFNYARGTNGPMTISVRSSIDNYATTIGSATVTNNGTTAQSLPININQAARTTAVTYRLYLHNLPNSNPVNNGAGFSGTGVDINLTGTAAPVNNFTGVISRFGRSSICLGDSSSIGFTFSGGVPPYTVQTIDNLGLLRTFTGVRNNTPLYVFPQDFKVYQISTIIDSNGTSFISENLSGSATITVNNSPVVTAVGTYSRNLQHNDGLSLIYAEGSACRSWLQINDALDGLAPGSTNASAQVYASVLNNNTSRHFVPRRLNIAATNNIASSVTLFFSQADFNNFNTIAQYHEKMPSNPSDTVGVLGKMLVRRTANSIETDSFLNTYTPTSVIWNASQSQWEVTFNVGAGQLNGNFYISSPFRSLKMVSNVSHIASTPSAGATTATVTVNWDSVAGVSQYRLRFRPVGGTWNASTINGKQRVFTTLSFNTTYEVQVRVFESQINQFMQGEYTRTYTFTTPAEPNKMPSCVAPIASVVVNNPISATVSWPSVTEGVTYLVQLRAKNTLTWGGSSTTGNSESFNALTPNTTYEFRVRTTCTPGMTLNGSSEFSPIDTFRTPAMENCGTISNVQVVTTTNNSATISWTPVAYATSYLVQTRLKNTETWGGSSTSSTSMVINNLTAASNYEFRVRPSCNPALALTATGGFSAMGEFTTLGQAPLASCLPPTNIQAFPTSNNINLTWNGTANDTTYFVQLKREDATTWGGGSTATTSRTMNNLQANTAYHIRIRTTCKAGTTTSINSAFSDTVFVVTTPIANKFEADVMDQTAIRVYPNPTRDWLHIDYTSQTEEKIQVIVRDMTGRIISTTQVNPMIGENPIDVNLQQATEGLYLVQVFQGNSLKFTNKIQKQ